MFPGQPTIRLSTLRSCGALLLQRRRTERSRRCHAPSGLDAPFRKKCASPKLRFMSVFTRCSHAPMRTGCTVSYATSAHVARLSVCLRVDILLCWRRRRGRLSSQAPAGRIDPPHGALEGGHDELERASGDRSRLAYRGARGPLLSRVPRPGVPRELSTTL